MTDNKKETIINPHETGSFESGVVHEGSKELNKSELEAQSEEHQTEGIRGDIEAIDQTPKVEAQEPTLESSLSDEQKVEELTNILNDHHKEEVIVLLVIPN